MSPEKTDLILFRRLRTPELCEAFSAVKILEIPGTFLSLSSSHPLESKSKEEKL
jgi:hypothetical protein